MTDGAMEHSEIASISALVTCHTGIKLTADHQSMIASASKILMLETGATLSLLLQRLNSDAALLDRLLSLVTIPESYFFRDPPHFDYIRERVIPVINQLRGPGHIFRVWSAGCAGGEEAYSLAMLFEEAGIGPQGVKLLACDISRRALSRARKGSYSAWSVRGERAMALADSVLHRIGNRYEVAQRFRSQVNFFYLNLAGKGYPSSESGVEALDLILCRNVLIYLDAATIRHVAQRLYDSLAPGGYLIPGPSDPLLSGLAPFEAQLTPGGLIYHKPGGGASRFFRESWRASGEFTHPETMAPTDDRVPARQVRRSRLAPVASRPVDIESKTVAVSSPVSKGAPINKMPVVDTSAATDDADLSVALYAQALLFMQQGNDEQALALLKKLLYLDPSLAVVHFTCGLLYSRLAQNADAQRAYRNAINHACALPAQQPLPLTEGEPAGLLVQAAQQQLNALHSRLGETTW